MPHRALTKTLAETVQEPGIYRDTKLAGFVLRVWPSGKKVYGVMRKVRGNQKNITVTIGVHGVVSAEQARIRAKDIIAQMSSGVNPNDNRKEAKRIKEAQDRREHADQTAASITLRKVVDDYFRTRELKPNTRYIYGLLINRYLGDWLDEPVTAITKDMVAARHTELSDHKAQANHVMRILRAMISFASAAYEVEGRSLIVENPVSRLSQVKAWHRVSRRQSVIKAHELKRWYTAVNSLSDQAVRDYLMLLLLTGMRKNEAATLLWRNVDFEANTLMVEDTKNRQDHMLPLTPFVRSLLLRRWKDRGSHEFVFYSENVKGRVYDCRAALAEVAEQSGVSFMLHDLRRTFITTAEELDIPHYALKRLANHKTTSDVTAGYIVADVERLRQPMQKVDAELLARCGVTNKSANTERSSRRK